MKKTVLLLLLVSALVIPAAFAQRGNPPDIATMVQHRVNHLTALLDLTTSQQAQATTIYTTLMTNNSSVSQNLRAARKQLQSDIQSTAPGATPDTGKLTADSAAVSNLEAQQRANESVAQAQFLSILTSGQQTKLNQLGGGFGGGFGGPGGFHGRP